MVHNRIVGYVVCQLFKPFSINLNRRVLCRLPNVFQCCCDVSHKYRVAFGNTEEGHAKKLSEKQELSFHRHLRYEFECCILQCFNYLCEDKARIWHCKYSQIQKILQMHRSTQH